MSVINTNVASMFAQRTLSATQSSLATSLQRLSSGLRINSAADDAAGLSIASRMTSQINGIQQATRNANDGISLAQTAEGGLNDITTSLQRLRTLAVQSANASNTTIDRTAIQTEASQLTSEISRVAGQTNFNGISLLDGSFGTQKFQVGADANQTITVTMGNATISKLGATNTASVSSRQQYLGCSNSTATGVTLGIGDLVVNGTAISAPSISDDTASSSNKSLSAIAKAAAINKVSGQTGVTATVNTNTARGVGMAAATALQAATSASFVINGITILAATAGGTDSASTRQSVVKAINAVSVQTGVTATDSGDANQGVVLSSSDGRNIVVTSASQNSALTGVKSGLFIGGYTLSSSSQITVSEGSGNIAHSGFASGTYSTQTAYASNVEVTDSGSDTITPGNAPERRSAFSAGDFTINGVTIGSSVSTDDTASYAGLTGAHVGSNVAGSAIAKAAAINRLTSLTQVTATANATAVRGTVMAAAALSGTLTINGVQTNTITTDGVSNATARQNTVAAINAVAAQSGVTAVDTGSDTYGVKLVAADGRNIMISNGAGSGLTSAATGLGTVNGSYYGSITLSSGKAFTIGAGRNNTSDAVDGATNVNGLDHLGLGAGTYGGTRTGSALSNVDLSTASGATSALSSIDNALATVNTQLAALGATENRFTSNISNLNSSDNNMTAARSRIQDADFAAETANLTRNQILQQAGVAMLGQANQLPQQMLSLLR